MLKSTLFQAIACRWVYLSFAMLLFASASTAFAQDAEPKGIVVWRIETKSGVTDNDIDSISGFITAEVEKYSGLKAVSDADIKTILQGERTRQQCGSDGESCIAEIGAALGVPEAVSGDLGRLGDYWILNLRRINVRTATVVARVGRQIKGDMNALIEAIPGAVAELFKKTAKPEPTKPEPTKPEPIAAETTVTGGESQSPETGSEMSALNKAAYGTFFSGVGLLILGGVGHWQMNEATDAAAAGESGAADRHAAWKGVAATGYALGGALMATGVVLWIVEATRGSSETDEAPVQLSLVPDKNGVSACVWGRW
jgi:hypothetical protein